MFRPRRPLLPHGYPERSEGSAFLFSPIGALSVPALSSSFFPPVGCELSAVNCPPLSPFPATLTDPPQLTENPATLSLAFATLTRHVKHNPFVCHSYRKQPGWGTAIVNFFVAQTPQQGKNLAVPPVPRHDSPITTAVLFLPPVTSHQFPVTASTLSLTPVTSHQSQITKSCRTLRLRAVLARRIRTYAKYARNSLKMNTSKTLDLKSFRIRTYKKRGGGGPVAATAVGGPATQRNPASSQQEGPSNCARAQSSHFFVRFFWFLHKVSSKYFTDAHSRITASSFGTVAFNSLSSTIPSAKVFAMLSSADPTSFISLETTKNSFSEVSRGYWNLESHSSRLRFERIQSFEILQ